jgi:hypothetical protein
VVIVDSQKERNKMSEIKEMVNGLAEQMEQINANEGHITIRGNTEDGEISEVTAVLSVYRNLKPSHSVLSELWDWAEDNKHEFVLDKIIELGSEKEE